MKSQCLPWIALLLLHACLEAAPGAPVEIVPRSLRGAQQPQAVAAADGSILVTLGQETNVFFVRSADGGKHFAEPIPVGSLPKLALGRRRGPRIAATSGRILISAISHETGNLVAWSSRDNGRSWSTPTRINSADKSAREGLHAMATGPDGAVYLAWLDLRNSRTELWMAASPDQGGTWSENRQVYKSPSGSICECCHPSLMVDSKGLVWAMWRNSIDGARDMFASFSRDGGRTFSEARKLGTTSWKLQACPMDGGQLVEGPAGACLSIWRREKSVVMADGPLETVLSKRGKQPAGASVGGVSYWAWEQGPELMLKIGTNDPVVLDSNGSFITIVAGKSSSPPFAAWEAIRDGGRTIVGEELR